MVKFTASEKQLVKNAIKLEEINLKTSPKMWIAFVENDLNFISEFDKKVERDNIWATANQGYATATFDEQIRWCIDSFRENKQIRELEA